MKKIIVTLLVIIIIAIIAIVVGKYNNDEIERSRFRLTINTWVGYGPLYLAQEKGFFAEEGLDIDIVVIEGVAERKAALLANRTDALGSTVDSLVFERDEGVPSVAVMELDISNGADGVVATNDIQTIQELRGKTVAVQKNFVGESFLLYLLRKYNVPINEVTMIDTETGAAGAAFVSKRVDVAVTWEPWLSKAQEREDGNVLVTSADEPGVIVDILTVSETALKERPEDIQRLMRAWFKAVKYWEHNTEEANSIMATFYDMSTEEFAEIISGVTWPSHEENVVYFTAGDNTGTIYDVAQVFSEVFVETGSIFQKPNMTEAIDRSLLDTLYK